jgi:hypothetical protein
MWTNSRSAITTAKRLLRCSTGCSRRSANLLPGLDPEHGVIEQLLETPLVARVFGVINNWLTLGARFRCALFSFVYRMLHLLVEVILFVSINEVAMSRKTL